IFAAPGAEAEMVQPDPQLHEFLAAVRLLAALDAERGAAADPIGEAIALKHLLCPEERHQLAVERGGLREARHRQDHVRHAVDFDHAPRSSCVVSALPFGAEKGRAAGLHDAADPLGASAPGARLALPAIDRPAMLEIAEFAIRLDIIA